MGTNVYYIKPITELEKKNIKDVIDNIDNYDDLLFNIAEILKYDCDYKSGDSTRKIHIGKRSAGWKFLFSLGLNKQFDIYHNFKENLKQFLATGLIVDEYGDKYDFDTFWKEFIEDFQDGIDSREYNKENPNSIYPPCDQYIDGYRFTNEICDFC